MASRADPLETMPVSRYGRTVRWTLRLIFGALIVSAVRRRGSGTAASKPSG